MQPVGELPRGAFAQIVPRGVLLVERRTSINVGRRSIMAPYASRAPSAWPLASSIAGAGEVFRHCVRPSRSRGCIAVVVISARLNRSDRRRSEGSTGSHHREARLAGQDPTRLNEFLAEPADNRPPGW
jgi:hypothetical protein